jgi:hypothetical protein
MLWTRSPALAPAKENGAQLGAVSSGFLTF